MACEPATSPELLGMTNLNVQGEEWITLTQDDMHKGRISVVALGRTGEGKSSVLNSIGRYCGHTGGDLFVEKADLFSVTKEIREASVVLPNNKVSRLIDTVGFFDTEETEDLGNNDRDPVDIAAATLDDAHKMVLSKLLEMIHLCPDGIHAFLIVVGVGRMTLEVQQTFQLIISYFGTQLLEYCIFVFTKIDLTPEITHRRVWEGVDKILRKLGFNHSIEHQCIFVNNREKDPLIVNQTMDQLFMVIDSNLDRNGGTPYVNAFFEKAQAMMKEEKARLIKEVEEKFNKIYEEQMQELKENFMKEFEDLKKQHTDEMAKMSQENVAERKKLEDKFGEQLKTQQSQQAKVIGDLKKTMDEQAKLDAQRRMEEMEKHIAEREKASKEHRQDMMRLHTELEKDRKEREARDIAKAREHKELMEKNRKDWQEEQKVREQQHNQVLTMMHKQQDERDRQVREEQQAAERRHQAQLQARVNQHAPARKGGCILM